MILLTQVIKKSHKNMPLVRTHKSGLVDFGTSNSPVKNVRDDGSIPFLRYPHLYQKPRLADLNTTVYRLKPTHTVLHIVNVEVKSHHNIGHVEYSVPRYTVFLRAKTMMLCHLNIYKMKNNMGGLQPVDRDVQVCQLLLVP